MDATSHQDVITAAMKGNSESSVTVWGVLCPLGQSNVHLEKQTFPDLQVLIKKIKIKKKRLWVTR